MRIHNLNQVSRYFASESIRLENIWVVVRTGLCIILLFLICFVRPAMGLAAFGIEALEQQINIHNGEFSTTNTTASPTNNSLGLVYFDSDQYNADTVYFEVSMKCDSCSGGNSRVAAALYNEAGTLQTTITTASSTYTRVRSTSLTLATGNYTVRFYLDATSGTAYLSSSRLIIEQDMHTGVTDTQTHIEIGSYENSTQISATALTAPKYYLYDHNQFSGTVNAYFEASFRTSNNDTTASYYFDNYTGGGATEWVTAPDSMVDGSTATYASTATDGDIQRLNSNTASNTNLGDINTVEVRAYGYQTDGSDGQVYLRPRFGGSSNGDNHTFTPGENIGSTGWSSYFDITTDTNAPSVWTWEELDNLDLEVEFNQGASGTNTAFIARVEVRVSYEDNSILAYAQLYNRTNSTIVATLSSGDNDISRQRSSALSSNWDTTNDDEYEVRLYTSDADNTAYLANAKIIIDQAQTDGIQELEMVHQFITSSRAQTNTIYTQESFINYYDPADYLGGVNEIDAYFEATMMTSAGTGYAMLYNLTGSDQIDTPTTSELTTTNTSMSRVRSANVADNSDWPTASRNLVSILKATATATTTVSNSWLVLRVKRLPAEVTFRIQSVSAGQTNNGVTTSVATTTSTIPFGNLSIATPKYAAHQLTVQTNAASTGYTVEMKLVSQLQGMYPANNIDSFSGNSATWNSPQTWTSPTGTTPNVNTGWIGANITDTGVSGWESGSSGKFGPVSTLAVQVMRNSAGEANDTEFVQYAVEVNVKQPADTYSAILQYQLLPVY